MRTTFEIDEDVLARVKIRAKHQRIPAGRLISEMLRQQLDRPPEIVMTNGIPVLKARKPGVTVNEAEVNAFLEELLREESGL